MKLTKQKLEQLILQEMRYYRPPEFDPRAEKNYPEYADKLSTLYNQDPPSRVQSRELAHSLDEPIDIETPDSPEQSEDFIPYGIRQFEQVSPVTIVPRNLGTLLDPGIVEIFFNTDDYKWVVAYYRGPNSGGGYSYDYTNSQEYSKDESERAIQHYNSLADNKFIHKST